MVLFSSSGEPEEVAEGYRLGTNSYVTEPADHEGFSEALRCLGRYWLDFNELPA